jgi:hypothetical protein
MRLWNQSLYPSGGFVLTDAEGITHRGSNVTTLATEIAEYRLRRGLPPGNPIAEVHEYLCARFPQRCLDEDPPSTEVLARTQANTLMANVAIWLRETWRRLSFRQVKWVANDEVVRTRVETCQACPFHQSVGQDCPVCEESRNQISFQLRAGRDRISHVLRTCTRYERDARVDVLMEETPDPQAPVNCWKNPDFLPL